LLLDVQVEVMEKHFMIQVFQKRWTVITPNKSGSRYPFKKHTYLEIYAVFS
jgi:hypothetical protein